MVFQFVLPKPIPYLQYRVCGGGLGNKGGILGIFSPASASIERTNIVGFLLLDFHTANIACASNHESARGGGGRFFSWGLNLKRFVSNKCGWAKGGFRFSVHAQRVRCNISILACLQHLAVIFPVYFWDMYLGGCSKRRKPSGLDLAKHSLRRPYFMYLDPYPHPIRYLFTPPSPSNAETKTNSQSTSGREKAHLVIWIIHKCRCLLCYYYATIHLNWLLCSALASISNKITWHFQNVLCTYVMYVHVTCNVRTYCMIQKLSDIQIPRKKKH